MHVHVNKGFSFLKVIQNCKYEKKNMESYVHFIYNVVQIKEHIDQYFQLPVLYSDLN